MRGEPAWLRGWSLGLRADAIRRAALLAQWFEAAAWRAASSRPKAHGGRRISTTWRSSAGASAPKQRRGALAGIRGGGDGERRGKLLVFIRPIALVCRGRRMAQENKPSLDRWIRRTALGNAPEAMREACSVAERAQENFMTPKIFVAAALAVASLAGTTCASKANVNYVLNATFDDGTPLTAHSASTSMAMSIVSI
jgi:hypothetical protein